jgi:hypothetical protein
MTPHEIFAHIPPATAAPLFAFLYEKEKPLYKATIEALAKKRHLRPVFIERKPRDERFAWLKEALGKPANTAVAAHVLQSWLVGAQSALLCDFLDALGIAHDDNGTVEQLPEEPEAEKLTAAVEGLLAQHDPAIVAIYLHTFQALHESGGWNTVGSLLESDPRLKLGE